MINLNECKFGDRLRTESGKMVLFICKQQPIYFYPFSKNEATETVICISESDNGGFVYMDYTLDGRNFDLRVPKTCSGNEVVGKWTGRSNTEEYIFGNKFKTTGGEMAVFIAKLKDNSFTENVLKYAFVMPYNNTFSLLLLEENDLHDKNNPNSIAGIWEDEV